MAVVRQPPQPTAELSFACCGSNVSAEEEKGPEAVVPGHNVLPRLTHRSRPLISKIPPFKKDLRL